MFVYHIDADITELIFQSIFDSHYLNVFTFRNHGVNWFKLSRIINSKGSSDHISNCEWVPSVLFDLLLNSNDIRFDISRIMTIILICNILEEDLKLPVNVKSMLIK